MDEIGRVFAHKESKICLDGCNMCDCFLGVISQLTRKACPPSAKLCKYEDKILKGEESVMCSDGCSDCKCVNGKMRKTEKICGKLCY